MTADAPLGNVAKGYRHVLIMTAVMGLAGLVISIVLGRYIAGVTFCVGIGLGFVNARLAGFGILGDPVRGDRQNQVFTYGGSVARAVATGAEVVAELNGRLDLGTDVPPLGTENRLGIRLGGRYTYGPVRIDGAFIFGANEGDSPWGLTFGATWVFKAFELK